MPTFPKAASVHFDQETMWVTPEDGRVLGIPLSRLPRLAASSALRNRVEISTGGLRWDELDEDISIDGLLAGRGDQTRRRRPTRAA